MTATKPTRDSLVAVARALPPRSAVGIVSRARLESIAHELLDVPVTLVTGAGGYGKTTLLLAWLAALAPHARTAWLTLVPEEVSLSSLVEGTVLACSHAFPDFGGSVRKLLTQRETNPRTYATAIANELYLLVEEHDEHIAIFIDDAHALVSDDDSLKFMSALLAALPERVHAIFASRGALGFPPIAKYRNAGRLLEIGEDALRFRADEAMELVGDREAAESLVEQTEGWAIAIHLTARLASERRIRSGTAMPAAGEAVFAFLAEEVVSLIEPDLRGFLELLAIPTTLDEAVVAHVLERDDGAAILARVAEQSLYIARTSDGSWRLHQLFREFLLQRLRLEAPGREIEARRRYAALLRGRGDKLGALAQLIDAGDVAEIVEYVKDAVVTVRFTDRYRRLLELLSQVPADVKSRKPVLYRFEAIALQRAGRWDDAEAALRKCYEAARANGDDGVACVALLERGISTGTFRFRMHGDHEQSARCFEEALALAEGQSLQDRPIHRKLAYEVLGLVHALRFDYDTALALLSKAERLELAEQTHTELLAVEIARVYMWLGDYRRALEYAELAEAFFRADAPFHVGYALIVQAKALVALREDRDRAIDICREAIESLYASYEDEELGAGYEALASALLAIEKPDLEAALDACNKAEQTLEPRNYAVRVDVSLSRARASVLKGDLRGWESAIRRAERMACGDRWLEARVLLERELHAQVLLGADADPEPFGRCVTTFGTMRDGYYEAVAKLGEAHARIRCGDFSLEDARRLINDLLRRGASYAVSYASEMSRTVMHWCLRNDVEIPSVSTLYERIALYDDPDLREIVRDEAAPLGGRVASLRALVARAGVSMRPLLRELSHDPEAPIASIASALLDELPPDSVLPLRIDVIPELRVAFGSDEIREGEARWGRKKAAELLRLLAVSGAPLSRNAALAALWPDAYQGRDVTLRVVVHSLRRALQPDSENPTDYIAYDGSHLTLRRSSVDRIDAETALSALQAGKHYASVGDYDAAERYLQEAVTSLSRVPKELSIPLWLQPHVQRWRMAALDGLRMLASIHRSRKRYDATLSAIRQALAIDSLDEATVALALECFAELGLFEEGQTLYATYKRRLMDALGTVPSPDVLERYARLLSSRSERKRTELSSREIEVVRLIANGKASKDVARALGLSVYTVNNHVGRILKKLGVESRAAAVAYVQREGL